MTETLSKLYLELSLVVPDGTKTARELTLEAEIERLSLLVETYRYGPVEKEKDNEIDRLRDELHDLTVDYELDISVRKETERCAKIAEDYSFTAFSYQIANAIRGKKP